MTDKTYYAVKYQHAERKHIALKYVRETKTQLVLTQTHIVLIGLCGEIKFNKKTGREVGTHRHKWQLITRDEYFEGMCDTLELVEENIDKYEEELELYKKDRRNLIQEIKRLDKELKEEDANK